jgi:two-component system OmpR family sensor kinase/two-component system sensor histidine kinase BaeS
MKRHWLQHRGTPPKWGRRTYYFFFVRFILFTTLTIWGVVALVSWLSRLIVEGGISARYTAVFLLILLLVGLARMFHGAVGPISRIMAAIDQVADGDLSTRINLYRGRQWRRLAHSFNHMVEELEQADRQRRHLTADVAHELRTPLHIIQGNLEGILDGVYEPTEEHINATLEETRLLARLVDDLRTLSLAEAGQLPLQLEQVDMAELLADMQTSFSGQAEAAQIDLLVDIKESLVITADPNRLDQILGNLLVNALRHTPAGGTIALCAEPMAEDIRLTVSDTGEGIPTEDIPYIFDRFWRGDRARTHTDGTGGGLGLAIVKQLVGLHNGRITVTSQVGRGTTFTIELPQLQQGT